jgi:serine/threonine protein kinase
MSETSNDDIIIKTMKNKSYDELHKMFKDNIMPKSSNVASTSHFFCTQKFFIKNIIKFSKNNVYEREKYMASILKKFGWYPELLYSNDINKILIFKNVGVSVTAKNKPADIKIQFNQILKDMKSKNVQHNDIKIGEILMDDKKKIYLCDFGWASINNNLNCGIDIWECNNKNKPGGYHNDDLTLTRLGLI